MTPLTPPPPNTPEPGELAPDGARVADAAGELLALLRLERFELDLFRGFNPSDWHAPRVFGGLVAAQALSAAIHTVEVAQPVHSFHSYFVRGGVPGEPIVYSVDRIRDGRSFTTRRVSAIQRGEAVFVMDASFHRVEEGDVDYQLRVDPSAPPPGVGTPGAWSMPAFARPGLFDVIETIEVGPTPPEADGTYRSTRRAWMRIASALPDDANLHVVALTFLSDMAVVMAARPPSSPIDWANFMGASLDHAMWFHRRLRADGWLYYDMHAVSTSGALGLARGTFHDTSGRLVASMSQEALMRVARPGSLPPFRSPEL